MKTGSIHKRRRQRLCKGALQFDLAVAMAILVVAMIPITHMVRQERQLCRALYFRSVALSLVDGETEILKAGEWKSYSEGEHPYSITAPSATVLPEGTFTLTRTNTVIRLEWVPKSKRSGGRVVREFEIEADL